MRAGWQRPTREARRRLRIGLDSRDIRDKGSAMMRPASRICQPSRAGGFDRAVYCPATRWCGLSDSDVGSGQSPPIAAGIRGASAGEVRRTVPSEVTTSICSRERRTAASSTHSQPRVRGIRLRRLRAGRALRLLPARPRDSVERGAGPLLRDSQRDPQAVRLPATCWRTRCRGSGWAFPTTLNREARGPFRLSRERTAWRAAF